METYDGPLPTDIVLNDATSVINDKVNKALAAARAATGGKSPAMAAEVYRLLGKPTLPNLHLAPIEAWASGLAKADKKTAGTIYPPRVEDSQYHDTTMGMGTRDLAPVMLVGQTLFGVDKLGHFFQIGYSYYYQRTLAPDNLPAKDAADQGDKSEAGLLGLEFTNVYSRADIAANRAGLAFYQTLATTPDLHFGIRAYLTDQWNEQTNPNLYTKGLTREMMSNNLPGLWQGSMNWSDGSTPMMVTFPVTFDVTGARTMAELKNSTQHFSGKYQYKHPLASFTSGEIDGSLIHTANGDGAVIASEVDLAWKEGAASGRGKLKVESLKLMSGTWGRGASATDGGTWRFTKSG